MDDLSPSCPHHHARVQHPNTITSEIQIKTKNYGTELIMLSITELLDHFCLCDSLEQNTVFPLLGPGLKKKLELKPGAFSTTRYCLSPFASDIFQTDWSTLKEKCFHRFGRKNILPFCIIGVWAQTL